MHKARIRICCSENTSEVAELQVKTRISIVCGSENTSKVADSLSKARTSNDPEIQSVDFDEDDNTVPSESHETTPESPEAVPHTEYR